MLSWRSAMSFSFFSMLFDWTERSCLISVWFASIWAVLSSTSVITAFVSAISLSIFVKLKAISSNCSWMSDWLASNASWRSVISSERSVKLPVTVWSNSSRLPISSAIFSFWDSILLDNSSSEFLSSSISSEEPFFGFVQYFYEKVKKSR